MCRERLGCNLRQRRDLTHLTRFLPDGNGPNGNPIFGSKKKLVFFCHVVFWILPNFYHLFGGGEKMLQMKNDHGEVWNQIAFPRAYRGTSAFRFVANGTSNGAWSKWMATQNQVEVFHGSSHCHWVMVKAFFNTKQWPIHRPRIFNFNQSLYMFFHVFSSMS